MKAREAEHHLQRRCSFVHFPCFCCNQSSLNDGRCPRHLIETPGMEENNGSQMRSKCRRSMSDPCPLISRMKSWYFIAAAVLVIKHAQMKLDILPLRRDWIVLQSPAVSSLCIGVFSQTACFSSESEVISVYIQKCAGAAPAIRDAAHVGHCWE